jgi:hypothetical protein
MLWCHGRTKLESVIGLEKGAGRKKDRGRAHRSGERRGKVGLFSGLDWMRRAPQRTN